MTIVEIYKEYLIMPQLREYQLKFAGAARVILENINSPLIPLYLR